MLINYHFPVSLGIATFSSSPATAFTSVQPLLDYALEHIPTSQHQHTSLYVFCTAGMRLLPEEDRDRIISVLRSKVAEYYPFHLPKDSIQVITGKMEGTEVVIIVVVVVVIVTSGVFQYK